MDQPPLIRQKVQIFMAGMNKRDFKIISREACSSHRREQFGQKTIGRAEFLEGHLPLS